MNVLQLISSKGFFGAENVLVQLASELNKRNGIQVIVCGIVNMQAPHNEVIDECKRQGIETVELKCHGRFDYHTIAELRRCIKRHKIDIVHTHGYKANIYSFLATIGSKIYRLSTCHNWINSSSKMKLYASIDRGILRRADCIVAVSDQVRNVIVRSGIDQRKIKKINNGISLKYQNYISAAVIENRIPFSIPTKATIVGCVGRISEEKGHRYLLQAICQIIEKYKDVYLVIIGDGDLKSRLEREYASPRIIFTGFRRDLDVLYPCMDIFVLPSLTEGLPMVLLEAMSWGLPVIATRVGQIPSVIENKKTGIIVNAGNISEIRDALIYYLENRSTAIDYGNNGREKVRNQFSAVKMADEYVAIYKGYRR